MNIVKFETSTDAVATSGRGCSGQRLLSLKEYREKHGLKRNEAKAKHAQYILDNGKVSAGVLAAKLIDGSVVLTGFAEWEKSGTVRFSAKTKASLDKAIAEPSKEAAKPTKASEMTVDSMSDEEISALEALILAKKNAKNFPAPAPKA